MTHPSTHELLQRLRAKLDAVGRDENRRAAEIDGLVRRLDRRIEGHINEDEQREILADIEQEIVEFEVEHPEVAGTLRNILNMLSSLGV